MAFERSSPTIRSVESVNKVKQMVDPPKRIYAPHSTIELPLISPTKKSFSDAVMSLNQDESSTTINRHSKLESDEEIPDAEGDAWEDWNHPTDQTSVMSEHLLSSDVQQSRLIETILNRQSVSSKPTWNPNAPLGAEFEIPSVTAANKTKPLVNDETDDFFKDMMPKVETVELMRQLETMFDVDTYTVQVEQRIQISSENTGEVSDRFSILQQEQENGQSVDEHNAWDD
jgi:hypothetical protein